MTTKRRVKDERSVITTRIDRDTHIKFRDKLMEHDILMSQFIRWAIRQFLAGGINVGVINDDEWGR
jgi:hypothetical protein